MIKYRFNVSLQVERRGIIYDYEDGVRYSGRTREQATRKVWENPLHVMREVARDQELQLEQLHGLRIISVAVIG